MKSNAYSSHHKSAIKPLIKNNFILNFTYNTIDFIKNQIVLVIATLAMLVTCFFVPIDASYLEYFNWPTLATLYCTLAVVAALSHIHVFEIVSKNIVLKLHNLRNATLGLVFITFVGSMLLANDMALLTFLPLGYFVLNSTDNKDAMAFTFIMQNIAANLGGMVTPFGNPQNLYLYAFYNINTLEFVKIMFPSFVAATVLIIAICLLVKPIPLTLKKDNDYELDRKRTLIYSILFVFSILMVFRVVPYLSGTIIVTIALYFFDKDAIKEVNYPLLATFCVFFVFSGNMARIPTVNDYNSLLPAVNIGGCGTLIASLASLITFTEYKKHNPDKIKEYLMKFTLLNVSFIVILYLVEILIK